jgi:glyoxylase-like metal-dependent hydrolase (beta-lactamase superfamily II)
LGIVVRVFLCLFVSAVPVTSAVAEDRSEVESELRAEAPIQKLSVGDVVVRVIRMGNFSAKWSDLVHVPVEERPSDYRQVFEQRRLVPFRTIVISAGERHIVVDPCRADWMIGTKYEDSRIVPGPQLVSHLRIMGVAPASVTHVVLTHFHQDHASGFTFERDGDWQLLFPNATHFLGRGDMEYPPVVQALERPSSRIARTIGVAQKLKRLELVAQAIELGEGVQIIPAPGETPGHLIVQVKSRDQTFYYVGDLYHATVEVEHPDWMASWNDKVANRKSRDRFIQAALAEDAMVLGSHLPLARLKRKGDAVVWDERFGKW